MFASLEIYIISRNKNKSIPSKYNLLLDKHPFLYVEKN